MSDQDFVHLHVHTEFSLLDGLSKIKKLVARAQALGMKALAITDHGAMFGVIDFYRACKDAGIKPIVGMEGYLARRTMQDRDPKLDSKAYHVLLLAQNSVGYRNLCKIASAAQLDGYYYRPRTDQDFLETHSEGLITTTGCLAGKIPGLIMDGQEEQARSLIHRYVDVFGRDNFFLELQNHAIPELTPVNNWLIDIAARDNLKLVATNDVHYVLDTDHDPHDTLLCIQTSTLKADTARMKMSDNSYFLTSQAQMWAAFGHIQNGAPLTNSLLIAEMCDLDLDRKGYYLPVFPTPEGHTSASYLRCLAEKGLSWRYAGREHEPGLLERLDRELSIIGSMGFDSYFLIVWDLCEFARHADIWWNVRGSGAGSLVAYCLGITNVDPLQNNLLFERFLNPGRVSMPDIDLDYPDDRRSEMISYCSRKYGEDKVAAIITFGTLGAKAAVRDVGRALDVSLERVNRAAKLIPTEPKPKPVMQYVEDNPDLKRMVETDPDIKRIFEVAAELQGVARHASTHAAGIIVGDKPLVEYLPLHRLTNEGKNSDGRDSPIKQVTQFPMEVCETIGLLKIDFLGLSTLTQLRRACELIERHHGIRYDMGTIPYRPTGDPDTDRKLREAFEMISRGETVGVFQVESTGMQEMLRGMRPSRFEHIIAAVSLYRPGPMDYIPDFNDRMHGVKEVRYHHEKLKPILEETFGIMVYQEQLMQIASELFSYSLADADLMRRAVSKKKKEDLMKHKAIFMTRGPENGIAPEIAEKIFDDIEFFANYGFNKSHAADYAVITCQSAYLKCHYREEYMAALLSVYFDEPDKVPTFLTECRRLGIPILAPDINSSLLDFDIQLTDQGVRGIRFGLAAIKNAGVGALTYILDARTQGGPFRDMQDFCERVDLRQVGKRTVESLIKVGAFNAFGTRSQLIQVLDRIVSYSAEQHKAKAIGQMNMFGTSVEAAFSQDLLANVPEDGEISQREMLNWEKELLGFYVSSHPIDPVLATIRAGGFDTTHDLKQAAPERAQRPVRLIGLVADIRKLATKNHEMMAVLKVEDHYSAIDVVFFPRTWRMFEDQVYAGAVLQFTGRLDLTRGDPQIICENISDDFETLSADDQSAGGYRAYSPPEWLPADEEDFAESSEPAASAPYGAQMSTVSQADETGNQTSRGGYETADLRAVDALPPEPPGLDELPWLLDNEGDAGPPPDSDPPAPAPSHMLIIRFARSSDQVIDSRRFKRILDLLTSYPGTDRFMIELAEAEQVQPLEFPEQATGICEALIRELHKRVGADNVRVERL
jgi:DNA polymerase-3 subunit alpha